MKIELWHKVFLGMFLGIGLGFVGPEYSYIFKPFATIYINLVKMIVVPTVFFAILFGMSNISDIKVLGQIGIKASILYAAATILAVLIGIAFASYFEPGLGVTLFSSPGKILPNTKTILDIIIEIIPNNPIKAMAEGNTLQVVVFAFSLGLALILTGSKATELSKVIRATANVVFKLVELVIKTTPYGVLVIMAWTVGEYGFGLILSLSKLILVIIAAFALQYLIFGLMLLFAKLSPWQFYRKTGKIQTLALATSSSKATIATALEELQEQVGVSQNTAEFVLPLGAATNMTGSAIYIAACALFFAQVYHVELSCGQYLILLLTSTVGSIGAAGYPGGGVIMLSMVLTSLGLPIEGIPVILGIDRFLDMFRTLINVTGDCAVTVLVDKLNRTLDLHRYNKAS